ncbi:MAG: bifunctional phosphoribosylaminoimidazolecarboxamide formyltransferase/IMP cyclohydrolase [Bauldia sp.]|nr:bifunctional phosphoribosylaminoimidazolecarboxamide formyltransferase/IMP cyclohydrolase [Bauldia sp.]
MIEAAAAPAGPDLVAIRRALVSVSDKTGLLDFARALAERGVEILSTGGTAGALTAGGVTVVDVSAVTGFPEIMDGRVKTLHPAIHGGLLGRRDLPTHTDAMREHKIGAIDLLVVNLYPFEAALASGADDATMVENIDVGGPAMIRAAAKNHAFVTVALEPEDYALVLEAMAANGGAVPLDLRTRLAGRAFARTAAYDAAIAGWFARAEEAPHRRILAGTLKEALRYGENPHQAGALYLTGEDRPGAATARQIQGKQLSYNNINDTNAAYELVAEFDPGRSPAVAIIKHANPCGVAEGPTLAEAYRRALLCDPVSAFGGVIALNRTLDAEAATEIVKIFTEVIIAPDATPEAVAVVAAKKNLRLLLAGRLPDPRAAGIEVRTVAGGFLTQSRDNASVDDMELKVVTRRAPSERELADLRFAFRVAKHVKSNAIVYAKDGATVGVGPGQTSRVDSAINAARKAREAAAAAGLPETLTKGSAMASEALIPFADGLEAAISAGATSVIQPGGAIRDAEIIAAADAAGIAMVFTGLRHFRH